MYTIGQVAERFQMPVSTLRYYDKEGLFPDIRRSSGIRKFSDTELEALRVIECLKRSGLEIKEIRHFMALCAQGPETYEERLEMFLRQRESIEAQIAQLEKTRAMIEFKCWYYTQALELGDESFAQDIPDNLPEEIRALYDRSHD